MAFAKSAFTKGGFRHVVRYIDGLITLNKKTVKQISLASVGEGHHAAINRVLSEAKFRQGFLEKRYLKKVAYFMKGREVSPLFDDTLAEHNGAKIEETQHHKDHSSEVSFSVKLHSVIFDSWYSDKKIINKCTTRGITVMCGIKTNRIISVKKGVWESLATLSLNTTAKEMENYLIDEESYKVKEWIVKLNGTLPVKLIISREWNKVAKMQSDLN